MRRPDLSSGLLARILAIIALVLVLAIGALWIAIDVLSSSYYTYLMEKYHVSDNAILQAFRDAAHGNLIGASAVALVIAMSLGYVLTRRLLRPLHQMLVVTKKVAAGDYSSNIEASSTDEIGELARSFNGMTSSLQRLEASRQAMVADVAHELRAPLTNMRGYLEALKDGVLPPTRRTLDSLHEETVRLTSLVDDLLQLNTADAAQSSLRLEPFDILDQLRSVAELFRTQAAAKEITIEIGTDGSGSAEVAGGRAIDRADPPKLARILHNLIDNAVRYTPEGGTIRISVRRDAARTQVAVANSGPGIAATDIPHIFERFYRGEKSRSREFGGAGIGLAIVKDLVTAHHGEVGAHSSPGENRIWFTLPRS